MLSYKTPKLIQINATANWGSTGKIAEGIGLEALKNGWESYIIYGRYENPSSSKLIKVGNQWDVYAHYAKHRFLDSEGLGSYNPTKKLISQINQIQPDIIHLHNIHDHWLNYPLLFKYLSTIDTPIIWTFHDCWAFTGGCAYFDEIECMKWQKKCFDCKMKNSIIDKSSFHFNLKKSLIENLDNRLTIVPVSNWIKNFTEKSFLNGFNIHLIHNGIDLSKFKITDEKNKKPLILGVALPWSKRKGLEDIYKIREEIPEEKADITIVGLDKQQLKELPYGINGIEKTQNTEELVDLYNKATVFINPTYSDNFPTTNLEALACGTPVITYNTGGSPEAIDNKTGMVIEKGNIPEMVNSINDLISGKFIFNAMDCRERVEKNFNKDIQFYKYLDLYKSVLN